MSKTALIVGATGLIGQHLTTTLLDSNEYSQVFVLVRRLLPLEHPKLAQVVVNFDALTAADIAGDDVFCCLGTTMKVAGSREAFEKVDYHYPLEVATFAQANGAKQFGIVTAMGADASSMIYYNRIKGHVETSLREVGFETLLIFRPSILLGERGEVRLGERIGKIFMRLLRPLT